MKYVLVNTKTGHYFKKEMLNGVCINVDNIDEAKVYEDYFKATCKAAFLSDKYVYEVISID